MIINKDVHEQVELNDFRQLINTAAEKYQKTAYKYKKDPEAKVPEYVEITYQQAREEIEQLATALLEMGLEKKKIALIGNNRYEWCQTYLAVTTANMIIVPIDKALPDKEIESLIKRSKVEAIVFENKYKENIIRIKNEGQTNLKYLINMDKDEELQNYQSLVKKGKELIQNGNKTYQEIKIDKDALAVLLFTSGTTKQPKAVMLSQYNICSNITAISGHSRMYETDTLLSFLPLHHTFECTITFLYGLYFGVTIAFCDGLKYIQKNLVEYEITALVAVPLVLENMYKKLQKGIQESGKENVIKLLSKISKGLLKCKIDVRKQLFKPVTSKLGGKLRIIFYGAAPMDKATILGFNGLGVDLIQGYGLTETSPVLACETDKDKEPGSVGYPLSNVDIQIQNPNEEGIGEIVVKGSSVMKGYYEDPEETNKVLKDGWFNTEDLGYLDEKGHLFVTGRKKDLIVLKNGKNIYPQEIEYLINKLPYVEESIVYATENENKDHTISAKIVYQKETMESLYPEKQEEYKSIIWEDIKKINQTIPTYKHIKKITITTEALEKTTTHKVKRFKEINKAISK